MMKYLKYYLSTLLIICAIIIIPLGTYYPTMFFIAYSLFIMLGDLFLPQDLSTQKYNYRRIVNLPIYINLFFLLIFIIEILFITGNHQPEWVAYYFQSYLKIDLFMMTNNISLIDTISLIMLCSLNIGMLGTVPGHELTHRKKDRIDMFFGNWLLSFSWDCAFALEHVYGHHKNVGLSIDPATAKRGENLYKFIIRASIKEHIDAWKIELKHLKRRGKNSFSIYNKMIVGYGRSIAITLIAFWIGGIQGLFFYIVCAFLAKALLEVINYIEHYGLVREPNKPVCPRHSWNANNMISSLILYNVNRHSAHHEKSNLHFWELEPYPNSPMLPYGYLTMLYLAIFLPFLFHKIMKEKLDEWDENFATKAEKNILIKL